tara:strand:- start:1568 stop:2308 length:741 start_codon:yes stop_codon:yes gene_type:complete
MRLILLRHGESQWNLENRFTGWEDVSLTEVGIEEALSSAKELVKNNIQISSIQTSLLKRAIDTSKIVAEFIKFPIDKIQYDWRLNERHYGALQGLNKSETAAKYGEDQVLIWRRSYDIAPPLLNDDDRRHPKLCPIFQNIDGELPVGESLKDVINRLNPFWEEYLNKIKKISGDHLIVAHSNSLRAIIKVFEQISDKNILSVNIPTGVPLIYSFNKNFEIDEKKYLINEKELKKKQDIIANQGKAR